VFVIVVRMLLGIVMDVRVCEVAVPLVSVAHGVSRLRL
jgi:hypothetical protein